MGYEGKYLSKNEILCLLNESWEYNHFKYDSNINNEEYFTDVLKKCDYDISKDEYNRYDQNKDIFFLKQRRPLKFQCKQCGRQIWFKFVNNILNYQAATGIADNGCYLSCENVMIKNIIE